jgi:hypothetical protein
MADRDHSASTSLSPSQAPTRSKQSPHTTASTPLSQAKPLASSKYTHQPARLRHAMWSSTYGHRYSDRYCSFSHCGQRGCKCNFTRFLFYTFCRHIVFFGAYQDIQSFRSDAFRYGLSLLLEVVLRLQRRSTLWSFAYSKRVYLYTYTTAIYLVQLTQDQFACSATCR